MVDVVCLLSVLFSVVLCALSRCQISADCRNVKKLISEKEMHFYSIWTEPAVTLIGGLRVALVQCD